MLALMRHGTGGQGLPGWLSSAFLKYTSLIYFSNRQKKECLTSELGEGAHSLNWKGALQWNATGLCPRGRPDIQLEWAPAGSSRDKPSDLLRG